MKSKGIFVGEGVNYLYTIKNLPKSEAEKYLTLLKELSPECEVKIVEEDVNLCQLGFVSEVPCTMEVGFTHAQAEHIYERILDMEASAYCHNDILDKSYHQLTEAEKAMRKPVLSSMKKYERYECLEAFLYDCLQNIEE